MALAVFLTLLFSRSPASAVYNGHPAGEHFPLSGRLYLYGNKDDALLCSGTLIAPNLVLTAAHCVISLSKTKLSFFLSDETKRLTASQRVAVLLAAIDSDFNSFRQLQNELTGISIVKNARAHPQYKKILWKDEANCSKNRLHWFFFGCGIHWDAFRAVQYDLALVELERPIVPRLRRTYVVPRNKNYFKKGRYVHLVGSDVPAKPAALDQESLENWLNGLVDLNRKKWFFGKFDRESQYIPDHIERAGAWVVRSTQAPLQEIVGAFATDHYTQYVRADQLLETGDSGGGVFLPIGRQILLVATISSTGNNVTFAKDESGYDVRIYDPYVMVTSLAHNHRWLRKGLETAGDSAFVRFED